MKHRHLLYAAMILAMGTIPSQVQAAKSSHSPTSKTSPAPNSSSSPAPKASETPIAKPSPQASASPAAKPTPAASAKASPAPSVKPSAAPSTKPSAAARAIPSIADVEFSGDIEVAKQAFYQLDEKFCESSNASRVDTHCHITSVRVVGDWMLYNWYEGETGGEAIAQKSGQEWQTRFLQSGYEHLKDAVKKGIPLAVAQKLYPPQCPSADLSKTVLKSADLTACSAWDLMIARNSIYARHGRPFQMQVVRDYFLSWPWYKPDATYQDTRLSQLENFNINLILKAEVLKNGGKPVVKPVAKPGAKPVPKPGAKH